MELTREERNLIIYGLQMRSNIIQTGDPNVSAQDVKRMGSQKNLLGRPKLGGPEIKALDTDQMKLCIQIDELIKKIDTEE